MRGNWMTTKVEDVKKDFFFFNFFFKKNSLAKLLLDCGFSPKAVQELRQTGPK